MSWTFQPLPDAAQQLAIPPITKSLSWTSQPYASIAPLQTATSGSASQASISWSFGSLPAVNNVVVVTVTCSAGGSWDAGEVTDNQGNTYTKADSYTAGGSIGVGIYYTVVATSSGTFTITADQTGSSKYSVSATEWDCIDTTTPVNRLGHDWNNGGTSLSIFPSYSSPARSVFTISVFLTDATGSSSITHNAGINLGTFTTIYYVSTGATEVNSLASYCPVLGTGQYLDGVQTGSTVQILGTAVDFNLKASITKTIKTIDPGRSVKGSYVAKRIYASSVSEVTSGSNTIAWTNPNNVLVDDSSVATVTASGSNQGKVLRLTGWDMSSVPTNATIIGCGYISINSCNVTGGILSGQINDFGSGFQTTSLTREDGSGSGTSEADSFGGCQSGQTWINGTGIFWKREGYAQSLQYFVPWSSDPTANWSAKTLDITMTGVPTTNTWSVDLLCLEILYYVPTNITTARQITANRTESISLANTSVANGAVLKLRSIASSIGITSAANKTVAAARTISSSISNTVTAVRQAIMNRNPSILLSDDFNRTTGPDDWGAGWVVGDNEADASCNGSIASFAGNGFNAFSFMYHDIPTTDKFDMVVKWRLNDVNAQLQVGFANTGATNGYTSSYLGWFGNEIALDAFSDIWWNSTWNNNTDGPFDPATSTWYWQRFLYDGSVLKCRNWIDGNPEPATWDDIQTPGLAISGFDRFYLGNHGSDTIDFDSVVVTGPRLDHTSVAIKAVLKLRSISSSISVTSVANRTITAVRSVTSSIASTVSAVRVMVSSRAFVGSSRDIIVDPFTGTNGDPWDSGKWTTNTIGAGSVADIQSNKGRLEGGAGSFLTANAISTMASQTDCELYCTFDVDSGSQESYLEITLRGDGLWLDAEESEPQNGYFIDIAPGSTPDIRLRKAVASVKTTLASSSGTSNVLSGVIYGLRFRAVGTAIKVRYWDTAGAEPSSWDFEVTDSDITAGIVQLSKVTGSAAAARTTNVDDLVIKALRVPHTSFADRVIVPGGSIIAKGYESIISMTSSAVRQVIALRSIASSIANSVTMSGAYVAARSISMSVANSVATNRVVVNLRTLAESIGHSVTTIGQKVAPRSIASSIGMTDTYVRVVENIRTISSSVANTMSAVANAVKPRAISMSVGITSVAERAIVNLRTISSSVAHTSAAVANAVKPRAIYMSVGITSVANRSVENIRTISSNIAHSVSMVGIKVIPREFLVSIAHTATTIRVVINLRTIAESIAHSVTTIGQKISPRSISMNVANSATFNRSVENIRTISSNIAHSITAVANTVKPRAIAMSVANSATFNRTIINIRTISSSIAHSVTMVGLKVFPKDFLVSIGHTATTNRVVENIRTLSSSIGNTMTVVRAFVTNRTTSSSNSITSSAAYTSTVGRVISWSGSITSAASKTVDLIVSAIMNIESLFGNSRTASIPQEALFGTSQTTSMVIEALQGLQRVSELNIEGTKGFSVGANINHETLIGLMQQSVIQQESLIGVATTNQILIEALIGLAVNAGIPHEALGANTVDAFAGINIEAVKALSVASNLNHEALQTVARLMQVNQEALQGITASTTINYEAVANLLVSLTLNYEALKDVTNAATYNYEVLYGLFAVADIKIESLVSLAANRQTQIEALAGIAKLAESNIEGLFGNSQTQAIRIEATQGVERVSIIPHEALIGISALSSINYEAGAGSLTTANAIINIEAVANRAVSAGINYEALKNVSKEAQLTQEGLQGILGSATLIHEALAGFLKSANVNIEALKNLSVTGAASYEVLSGLSKTAQMTIESLQGVLQNTQFNVEATKGLSVAGAINLEALKNINLPLALQIEALAGNRADALILHEATKGVSVVAIIPYESGRSPIVIIEIQIPGLISMNIISGVTGDVRLEGRTGKADVRGATNSVTIRGNIGKNDVRG